MKAAILLLAHIAAGACCAKASAEVFFSRSNEEMNDSWSGETVSSESDIKKSVSAEMSQETSHEDSMETKVDKEKRVTNSHERVPSSMYKMGEGVPSSVYKKNTENMPNNGVPSSMYKMNEGVPSSVQKMNQGVPPSVYKMGEGVPSSMYKENAGVPSSMYKENAGVPSSMYKENAGVPSSMYKENAGVNEEVYKKMNNMEGRMEKVSSQSVMSNNYLPYYSSSDARMMKEKPNKKKMEENSDVVEEYMKEKIMNSMDSSDENMNEKMMNSMDTSEEEMNEEKTGLPWMPTGIVMSDDTIIAMENLWNSMEALWKKKMLRKEEEEIVFPTGIIMKNGDTVPLENFFNLMDKIFSSNKATDAIPKFKAVPAMTRDKEGILVYPDGSPVPLPSKDDKDLPVIGWNQHDDQSYSVSLLDHKGSINQIQLTTNEFKDLLEGKNVAIKKQSNDDDSEDTVGAQFAGGYKMYGYPGMFGCPYYSPCSPMYGGMHGQGHAHSQQFYMSSSGSSHGLSHESSPHGSMGYQPYW